MHGLSVTISQTFFNLRNVFRQHRFLEISIAPLQLMLQGALGPELFLSTPVLLRGGLLQPLALLEGGLLQPLASLEGKPPQIC